MPPIRVLVVDDSVVIRRLVGDAIAGDPDVEIAGVAANGSIALQKVPQVNPDVITLDIEMPEMNGLETLKHLRKSHPKLPVIMFSTLTQRGAEATLDALALGASDYVTKPANVGSVTVAVQRVRDELLPKIKALGGKASVSGTPIGVVTPKPQAQGVPSALSAAASAAVPLALALGGAAATPAIIAIGVSTGGPNALAEIIPALPQALPTPVVIVQHMPPMFTRLLAERLNAQSQIRVEEAIDGRLLEPGLALIAPGDHHMRVVRRGDRMFISLNQEPPENSCRPAVDPLFRSVAELYGRATLALVLTGMGQDGLRGCEHVHAHGGRIFVQDEPTSIVWGMPGFVAKAGLAQRVLPLDAIAAELSRTVLAQRPPAALDRATSRKEFSDAHHVR